MSLVDKVVALNPKLWSKCYPRVYSDPPKGQFASPKGLSSHIFGIAQCVDFGHRGDTEIHQFNMVSRLVQYRVPMFFIAPPLMEAMTNTKTPSDIAWMDMQMPFEAAAFMLPKGTLRHPTEGDVEVIGYARFHAGEVLESMLADLPYGVSGGGLTLFAATKGDLLHHWSLPADVLGPRLSLTDLELYQSMLDPTNSSVGVGVAGEITADDNALMVPVAHYVFSTLLIMTERAEMIEPGSLQKRVQKRGEAPREFWSPNVIGSRYAVKRESGLPLGSHNSPRMHFVRGFWRQQMHGEGRLLRRLMWIEPFVRGG